MIASHKRRLAHAVPTDDRDRLAAHRERDVVERLRARRRTRSALRSRAAAVSDSTTRLRRRHSWRARARGRDRGRVSFARISSGVPSTITRPSCIIVTRSATRSAMSMSCSMRISVMLAVEPEQEVRQELPLATREPGGGLVEHEHPSAPPRAPSRSRPADARRARGSRRARRACGRSRPCRAASRARSRIARSRPGKDDRSQVAALDADDRQVDAVLDASCPRSMRDCWYVRASPSFARRAGRPMRDVLARRARPCPPTAGSRPQMTLKSVVLPAPFGPRIARRSPSATRDRRRGRRGDRRNAGRPPERRVGAALRG